MTEDDIRAFAIEKIKTAKSFHLQFGDERITVKHEGDIECDSHAAVNVNFEKIGEK